MRGSIVSIQLLRGIAAFMVVLTHYFPFDFRAGQGGVDIFFVISGFIMVATTFDQFGSAHAAGSFFVRRILRIVPLYFVTIVVILGFLKAGVAPIHWFAFDIDRNFPGVAEIAANFLFIPFDNLARNNQPLSPVGWSLNLEMLFYVLFAVALMVPRIVGLAVVSSALILLVMFGRRLGLPTAMEGYWTDPIIINFIFGMAIGYAYRLGLRLPLVVGLILAALAVANLVHVFGSGTYGLPIRMAIGLSGAMAVGACAFSFPQTSFGLLKYPILWIGDWSYATYLTHGFTLRVCWNYGLSVPATLAWVLVVSAVAYWVIERPAHVLGRKLLHVGRSEPRQAAAPLPA